MRLIDADALQYRRKDYDCYDDVSVEKRRQGIAYMLKEDIDNAPTIDPVKHGKWIVVKRHEHYPSGKPYEQVQCPLCKRFDNNGDGSFCGYCGAMMERSEE